MSHLMDMKIKNVIDFEKCTLSSNIISPVLFLSLLCSDDRNDEQRTDFPTPLPPTIKTLKWKQRNINISQKLTSLRLATLAPLATHLTRPGSWSQREERAEEELTIRLWAGLV